MRIRRDLLERLRTFANKAHVAAMTNRSGVTVWWDCEQGTWHLIPAHCGISRMLVDRLDAETIRLFVGQFEAPCTEHQIFEALEAHAVGRLVI